MPDLFDRGAQGLPLFDLTPTNTGGKIEARKEELMADNQCTHPTEAIKVDFTGRQWLDETGAQDNFKSYYYCGICNHVLSKEETDDFTSRI